MISSCHSLSVDDSTNKAPERRTKQNATPTIKAVYKIIQTLFRAVSDKISKNEQAQNPRLRLLPLFQRQNLDN
jgi:dsRNA-specific ribonuclease